MFREHRFAWAGRLLLQPFRLGHLHPEEELCDRELDVADHLAEEVECLVLVLDERVLSAVPPQADALLEEVHGVEMVFPARVNGAQDGDALEFVHGFGSEALFLFIVGGADDVLEVFEDVLPLDGLEVHAFEAHVQPKVSPHPFAESTQVPLVGERLIRDELLHGFVEHVVNHFERVFLEIRLVECSLPLSVNDLALLVHHVIVLEEMFADFEVVRFDAFLRGLDGFADERVLDGLVLLDAEPVHHAHDAVGAEEAHQVVLERDVEAGGAGVALTSRATSKLVVDSAALMAFGADYVEAAKVGHAVAQLDVGAASGHVGGYGDCAPLAGSRDDLRLFFVVFRVQDVVRDALLAEHFSEKLRFFDRDGAHQHGSSELVHLLDFVDDSLELLALGLVDDVGIIVADKLAIRRDDDHVELVDVVKLLGLGVGGAGHAREFLMHLVVILESDCGERLVGLADLHALFRFERLMQPVAVASARHQPARELVNDDDFVVGHDVVNVALEERVRLQQLRDCMDSLVHRIEPVVELPALVLEFHLALHLGGIIEGIVGKELFEFRVDLAFLVLDLGHDEHVEVAGGDRAPPLLGEVGHVGFLVNCEIQVGHKLHDGGLFGPLHEGLHQVEFDAPDQLLELGVFHEFKEALVLWSAFLDHEQFLAGLLEVALFKLFFGFLKEFLDDALLLLVEPVDAGRKRLVLLVGLLDRAGYDERGARLVNEHTVHLVNDSVMMPALHLMLFPDTHVVAQVIEPELAVGAVGDVGPVVFLALLGVHSLLDAADGQPEELVDRPHPLAVATGEVIVDRDQVHSLAGERVEVDGQCRDERFSFAGGHFRDLALVEDYSADELAVEGHHVPRDLVAAHKPVLAVQSAADLFHRGERFGKDIIEGLALGQAKLELGGLRAEFLIRESGHLGLVRLDFVHKRQQFLDVPLVLSAKNFFQKSQHCRYLRSFIEY